MDMLWTLPFLLSLYILGHTLATISSVTELKDFCNPTSTRLWSPSTETCMEYFRTPTTNFQDAEEKCNQSAPDGTTGRLVHIPYDTSLALAYSLATNGARVGAKRVIQGQTTWNPKSSITDFRWVEGQKCTTVFNGSVLQPNSLAGKDTLYIASYEIKDRDSTQKHARLCEYYLGQTSQSDCEQPISTVGELEDFCAADPANRKWSPSSSTCIARYTDKTGYPTAYENCRQAAPPGTTGRLLHVVNSDLLHVENLFPGGNDNGWIGGKAYVELPKTMLYNFRWMEGSNCTNWFNASLFAGRNNFLEKAGHSCMLFFGSKYKNNPCNDYAPSHDYASARYCEYYIGETTDIDCNQEITTESELKAFCALDESGTGCNQPTCAQWSPSTSSCFVVFKDKKTYEDSDTDCMNSAPAGTSGHLAKINSEPVKDVLVWLLSGVRYWVGLRQMVPSSADISDWAWSCGGNCTTPVNVTFVEQNVDNLYGGVRPCMYKSGSGKFSAAVCTNKNERICEYTMGQEESMKEKTVTPSSIGGLEVKVNPIQLYTKLYKGMKPDNTPAFQGTMPTKVSCVHQCWQMGCKAAAYKKENKMCFIYMESVDLLNFKSDPGSDLWVED